MCGPNFLLLITLNNFLEIVIFKKKNRLLITMILTKLSLKDFVNIYLQLLALVSDYLFDVFDGIYYWSELINK